MRYICAKANQDEVNADLRSRFGETCTRTQILAYRDETGIDPRWIRKNPACYVARAVYRIPGSSGAVSASVSASLQSETPRSVSASVSASPRRPMAAQRERVRKSDPEERAVISSPFDSGDYDEPVAEVTTKKTRRTKVVEDAAPYRPDNLPAVEQFYVHAWVCDARASQSHCPGRKPGTVVPADGKSVMCECGSTMTRHAWAPSKRLF